MITIYHIEGRRSLRVIWICEELGLPYEVLFRRGDVVGSMMDIRQVHSAMPFAPTVVIGNQLIMESGAILEILLRRFGAGRLAPAVDSDDFLFHSQWMHYAEGTAMMRIALAQATAAAQQTTVDLLPVGYAMGGDLAALVPVGPLGVFEHIEDYLSRHPYFGGEEFSAADIMMHWSIRFAKLWAWIDCADYPHILDWRTRVERRPAFCRASNIATPDGVNDYGLPRDEPIPPFWPEPTSGISMRGFLKRA